MKKTGDAMRWGRRGRRAALWVVAALMMSVVACGDDSGGSPVEGDPANNADNNAINNADNNAVNNAVNNEPGDDDLEPAREPGVLSPAPAAEYEAPPVFMQRLTQAQYRNVARDILGDDVLVPGSNALEPDSKSGRLVAVSNALTTISTRGVEQYEAAAYLLAEQAMGEEARRASLMTCEPTATVDDECAREFIESVGRRLWRRALTQEEVAPLVVVASDAAQVHEDFYKGLEYPLAALFQSPSFLFRVELGEDDPERAGERRFTSVEMASRLSFLLWNSVPDEALLSAGESGELVTDEGVAAQVQRMLEDPRARRGVRAFFTDMFGLDDLDDMNKDPTLYSEYSPEVGAMAREETLLGIENLVFERYGDYRSLMNTRRTFVNRKLASIYDVRSPVREGYGEVVVGENSLRRGLLGQVSFLAGQSHPVGSSATLRGKFVRQVLMCGVVPPPPSNVDTSIPEPSGEAKTLRERVAEHLENPSCANCHLIMDPIGLAMENFDALGQFRTRDNGELIDASGDLDGVLFDDPRGLADALYDNPEVVRCLVETLFQYATARERRTEDIEQLRALRSHFVDNGHRVRVLLYALANSDAFRKSGEVQ